MEPTKNQAETSGLLDQERAKQLAAAADRDLQNQAQSSTAGFPVVTIPYFKETEVQKNLVDQGTKNSLNEDAQRHAQPLGDLTENPDEWIEPAEKPRPPREKSSSTEARYREAMSGLVDSILDRFPLAAPAVLLFVGSEANTHVDDTCATIAGSLAERNVGEILLIDSNFNGSLSKIRNLNSSTGIGEVVNDGTDWKPLTVDESSGMDFMPAGKEGFNRWGGAQRLRKAIAEIKQSYQFICVSGGDAHDNVAKSWSSVCDGSYLLVSLKNSNETIAESAVTELQTSGARLLGCVVTDLD
jgi:Mrp family chromosome partitioning ATPase